MEVRPASRLSINLRWIGIAYVLVVLCLAVFGVEERFFPASSYAATVERLAWAHAAFGGALTLGAGLLPDLKTGRRPPYIYFVISAPVMIYAGYASVAGGAPYIAHLMSDRPRGEVLFRIDDFTLKHGSCKNGLKVSSTEHVAGRVCGLTRTFRDRFKAGDGIVLLGPQSDWGIEWDDLRQAEK